MYSHRTERKNNNLESKLLLILKLPQTPYTPSEKKNLTKLSGSIWQEGLKCVSISFLFFFLSRLSTNNPSFEPNVKIRSRGQELNLCKCVYTPTHLYGIVFSDRQTYYTHDSPTVLLKCRVWPLALTSILIVSLDMSWVFCRYFQIFTFDSPLHGFQQALKCVVMNEFPWRILLQ